MTNPATLAAEIRKLGYEVEVVERVESTISGTGAPLEAPIPEDAPGFFTAGFREAKKLHRPLLIDFWAEWCAPCIRLNKETLEDSEVRRALEDFQVIHVDLDKYPELARAYGVTTIPDVVFVDPAGFVVDRLHGFEPPSDFLSRLREVTRGTTSMLQPLSEDGRELQQAFNAETGKVRLILLVSPG